MPDLDYQAIFQSAPSLFLILDPNLTIVAANDAFCRATLSQRDKILGRFIFDAFPDNPDPDATGVRNLRASLERVLETRQADSMAVQKYDIVRPDSLGGGFEVRYWSAINSPILDPFGNVVNIIHRVEDITEFVQLSAAEHTRAEHMAAEVLARSQELGTVHRQLRGAYEGLADVYREVSSLLAVAETELRLDPGDEPGTEDLVRAIKRLIARHKRLELEFRQAQKMEAVGRLAGGIAHDFNNILTVILGYCKLLLSRIPADDPVHRQLNDIRTAGERAAELTRQLLIFSRKQVLEPKIVSLGSTLEDMDRMFRRVLGADIEIATIIEPNTCYVKVDPTQIQQVLMNLVVNARDAMPNGGKLTIELRKQTIPEGVTPRFEVPPGEYTVLSVTDSGSGMSNEIKSRIFEPFFTTKEPGRGTGLGLSTVYGIIKQSGGHIWVYSELGVGTSFRVFFPRVADSGAPVLEPKAPAAVMTGTETILVVEDDDLIRTLIHEILGDCGYNIMGASRGAEAIDIAKRTEIHIDLLLTDMVLPGMNGKEVAESLRAIRPGMPVLYMSGYTGDSLVHGDFLSDPQTEFLQKPFTPENLCERIRATLDGSVASPR